MKRLDELSTFIDRHDVVYECQFNAVELDLLYEVVRQVRNEHDPNWQPEPGSWGDAICQLDVKLTEMFHKRRR